MKSQERKRRHQIYYTLNSDRKGHLEDLILIIHCMYGHKQTRLAKEYYELLSSLNWTLEQKNLLQRLIKSLTILNQVYRKQDDWCRLKSSKEDVYTALNLMNILVLTPSQSKLLLDPVERRFYRKLWTKYSEQPFTITEASRATRSPKSTAYWRIQELIGVNLAKYTGKRGQAYLYQLLSFN